MSRVIPSVARDLVLSRQSAGLLRFARNNGVVFEKIVSLENLFSAWREFKKGKSGKLDVQRFEFNLEDNLFGLHADLANGAWRHSHYTAFNVCDPKLRRIHKACVRDRVLHHAIFRVLYPIFDKSFIFDSYSCRLAKGTHKAVSRLEKFCRQLSRNNVRNTGVLKCDIKKFFDSIDQNILLELIRKKITDEKSLRLVSDILGSFEKNKGKGLPLGNVTSQLFANIYLNELDQFAKHTLRIKHYLRYCDDFIILSGDREYLEGLVRQINIFLSVKLKLSLHPDKIIVRKHHQGIDWLGYVILPHYRVLRTKTKRRILRKMMAKRRNLEGGFIEEKSFNQSLQSYLGVLRHCEGRKIKREIEIVCGKFSTIKS
ncbi:reverse transcriptase/maturase family protein [Patescibacteria group bacterium]|nr:reverse transcriptase/maturase family protein [Patescibacteria group bacterium]